MTDETKVVERLDKALNDFKELHARVETAEKNGEKIPEFESALNKVETEVQNAIKGANESREEAMKRLDEIELEMNRSQLSSGKRSDLAEAAARFQSAVQAREVDPSEVDVDKYVEYRNAMQDYLRHGGRARQASNEILRDIKDAAREGSDPDGGYFVTDEMDSVIARRRFNTSPMRQYANVRSIGTAAYSYLISPDEAAVGGWVGEENATSETATAQYKKGSIPAHKQYAEPRITEELLADASIDIEAEVGNKGGDILTRTENTAYINGSGSGQPKGILQYTTASGNENDSPRLTWGQIQYIASGAAGGYGKFSGTLADEGGPLLDLITELNPAYRANAVYFMNRGTLAATMKLRDANGNYLWQRSHRDGILFELNGFSVVEFEDMPDIAADSLSIGFGDLRQAYTIVDRQGVTILRDPYTTKGVVKYYMTTRVGGGVTNTDAVKLLKFAAS